MHKTDLSEPPPPQEKKRGLKGKMIAKKTGEMKEEMQSAAALVHSYVPPDPQKLQAVVGSGKLTISPAASRYVLHFDKGQTPPTEVTWSVSMYDPEGFYVPNPLDRYNLTAWMPLQYNPDGSLDLYIQSSSPGADKESNWLPAPANGPFNLTVRIFWPAEAVIDCTYKLPPVRKVSGN